MTMKSPAASPTRPKSAPDRPVPAVSIIVISFNTRDLTLDCLRSVEQETTVPYELIVVDNASSDGSAEAIAEAFPDITLIAEDTNHGFAGAHRVAEPHANAPFLLLLNPDTVVLENAIDKLLAFAEHTPAAGIWGGRTVFPDGALNPTSVWGRATPWSTFCRTAGLATVLSGSALFNPEGYGGWMRDSEREVDIVTGCFLLIRRELWDRLGGFDLSFFMYGEEADLCLRARALGASPRFTPEATIVHLGGASEPVREDKVVRLLTAKNRLIERHTAAPWRSPEAIALRLWPLTRTLAARSLAALTRSERWKRTADVWGAVWRRRAEWSPAASVRPASKTED
ncbi:glycosyltransferase family 2 protein [Ovoidimarina sediminis]|uniref:glycosyltransferase family 2 protein n=1 Tax=Ovoidimarina sediminis TaxID=3079856 RepID=UPI0029076DB8|nr:glycosyltransferase family 2 protein [Rhodophyticola sp. MJ-SS7]MDU8943271.1 glycosyltransferase family 2 protein [Rhodophyticola sp. MJ-SS7]